jgi:hypothetical protein
LPEHARSEIDPEYISDDEPLSRFVTDTEQLNKPPGHVHWRAFRPKPLDHDLSIARIVSMAPNEIWQLGDDMAGGPSGRTVCGRADFWAPHVRAAMINGASLSAIPAPPPPRHAAIIGWIVDPDGRKALAMVLAAEASQFVR